MKRDYKLFVRDIVEAIDTIEQFVGDMSFEEFMADTKTNNAVVWQIHIIGEASKNIPARICASYDILPWKDMAGMRDKISHTYFGIDYKIVWRVIKKDLPMIKPSIEKMLTELK